MQKVKRWRSEKYKKFARDQGCAFCIGYVPASEFHHMKGTGHLSGSGLKAPDWAGFGICLEHHQLIQEHKISKYEQWEAVARLLGKAVETGFLKL